MPHLSLLLLLLLLLSPSSPSSTCSGSGGKAYLGGCYFKGSVGGSCSSTCAGVSLPYDSRTRTVIGDQGSLTACQDVLELLPLGTGVTVESSFAGTHIGCAEYSQRSWFNSEATTAEASYGSSTRACACGCPAGTFQTAAADCQDCSLHCTRCTSATTCTQCDSQHYGPTCGEACSTCLHGTCTPGLEGGCACHPGWSGEKCDQCAAGYFGPDCTSCSLCDFHGSCTPGPVATCTCDPGWDGASCDRCAAQYFGANCLSCAQCLGDCEQGLAGTCVCPAGASGSLCDVCQQGYLSVGGECAACSSNCGGCSGDVISCTSCVDGYYGQGCSLLCETCNAHGKCTSGLPGGCTCEDGWRGESCSECIDCGSGQQAQDLTQVLYIIIGALAAFYLLGAAIYARVFWGNLKRREAPYIQFVAFRLPAIFAASFDLITDVFFAWGVSVDVALTPEQRSGIFYSSLVFFIVPYVINLGVALRLAWKEVVAGGGSTKIHFSIVAATFFTGDYYAAAKTCQVAWEQLLARQRKAAEALAAADKAHHHSTRVLTALWAVRTLGEDLPQLVLQSLHITLTSSASTMTVLSLLGTVMSIALGSLSFFFFSVLPRESERRAGLRGDAKSEPLLDEGTNRSHFEDSNAQL